MPKVLGQPQLLGDGWGVGPAGHMYWHFDCPYTGVIFPGKYPSRAEALSAVIQLCKKGNRQVFA
jgi:hypothetical protein